jgi:exonuclease V gamma subunit
MPFNLYKKYKLEELSLLCCQKVCTPENNGGSLPDALSLLQPVTIVVQTSGTAEYLRQQIARHCGIAANVNMPYLNKYLNKLLTGIYGESYTAAASASPVGTASPS